MPAGVGAQFAAQGVAPRREKVGELGAGERLSRFEEFITEAAFRKPVCDSGSASRETGRVVITAGEKPNKNKSAASELDRRVCEDIRRSIDGRVVTVNATIGVLRGVLIVASEIDAWARLRIK